MLMMETLCAEHLAQVQPLTKAEIQAAIDKGWRDYDAVMAAPDPALPGFYR